MATAGLVPCLVQLRTDMNNLCPNRSKASDGWVGNSAHQQNSSDHNWDETGNVPIRDADKVEEVHAVDLTKDLREPNLTMEMVVQHVLSRCRSGAEKRLRYIIFDRRIWRASNDWRQEKYSGSSPHTEHAHFSASYETKLEADTSSWRLEDIPVALTDADKKWLVQQIDARADQVEATLRAEINAVAGEVLGAKTGDPTNADRTVRNHLIDLSQLRDYLVAASNAAPGAIKPTAPVVIQTEAARETLAE
jgi:hypothetical protein